MIIEDPDEDRGTFYGSFKIIRERSSERFSIEGRPKTKFDAQSTQRVTETQMNTEQLETERNMLIISPRKKLEAEALNYEECVNMFASRTKSAESDTKAKTRTSTPGMYLFSSSSVEKEFEENDIALKMIRERDL